MSRKEILSSPEYWIAKIQMDLYNCAEEFMADNNMNRTQLAQHLGVSKSYISQLLNGDFDHKLSKLVELAIAFGVVPKVEFQPIADTISEDQIRYKIPDFKPHVRYIHGYSSENHLKSSNNVYEVIPTDLNPHVA